MKDSDLDNAVAADMASDVDAHNNDSKPAEDSPEGERMPKVDHAAVLVNALNDVLRVHGGFEGFTAIMYRDGKLGIHVRADYFDSHYSTGITSDPWPRHKCVQESVEFDGPVYCIKDAKFIMEVE
jgi:hypothetical protein